MANNDVEKVFGWDDEIENDGSGYSILPAGDYGFKVLKLVRERNQKGQPRAALQIQIYSSDGRHGSCWDRITLTSKSEWKISQFFRSIGMKKKGEKLAMNWNAVEGKTGKCRVVVDDYVGRDGSTHQSNKIDTYYDYADDQFGTEIGAELMDEIEEGELPF